MAVCSISGHCGRSENLEWGSLNHTGSEKISRGWMNRESIVPIISIFAWNAHRVIQREKCGNFEHKEKDCILIYVFYTLICKGMFLGLKLFGVQ